MKTTILASVCMLLFGSAAQAADVSVDINDAGCDDVIGTPYCSISAALNAAVNNDVITVRAGLYSENINFNGKVVYLRSETGPTVTEINGQGGTTVVIGPLGRIEGFMIIGKTNSIGAGMNVIGTGAVIKGNIFDGNLQTTARHGAGIDGNNASATIDGNIFRNHRCDSQFLSGVISFVNTSSPLIINNLFANNDCRGINMTLPATARPAVLNNTFVANPAGIYFRRSTVISSQTYRNNIVYGNIIGIEVDFGKPIGNPVFENNNVFGNLLNYEGIADQTGIAGNISVDPLFADDVFRDYRLLPTSPAIDSAIEQQTVTTDLLTNARPIDGDGDMIAVPDLGAYEASPPTADAGADTTVDAGSTAVLDALASSDVDGTIVSYDWVQTGGTAVTLINAQSATTAFIAPATAANLAFQVTVMDDLDFVDADEVTVIVNEPPPRGSSGGCTVGPSDGSIDPTLLLLMLISLTYLLRRRLSET